MHASRHKGSERRDARVEILSGLLLLLAALALGGCGGDGREDPRSLQPSWSPDGRAIASFVDPKPSAGCQYGSCVPRMEIWLMRADGENPRRLARGQWPAWSPDGRTIAFVRHPDPVALLPSDLYSIRADGTDLRRLTRTRWDDFDPVWSPDGRKIAFVYWPLDGPKRLYLINADGTSQRPLSQLEPYVASWSPKGTSIAFMTFYGLFTVGANGDHSNMLFSTPEGGVGDGITWSPDGNRIAFGVNGRLVVVDTDGRLLVRPGKVKGVSYPVWSPDGRKIMFSSCPSIDVVNADGSNRRHLTTVGDCEYQVRPQWSPDGRRIAFPDKGDIYVMNADGTGRRNLSDSPSR